jgi:hypothetical protein
MKNGARKKVVGFQASKNSGLYQEPRLQSDITHRRNTKLASPYKTPLKLKDRRVISAKIFVSPR